MSTASTRTSPDRAGEEQVTKVTAGRATSLSAYVAEVWRHKGLVRVLAGRQLKAQHELNLVGFFWWLLEPLSFAAVYYVIVDVIFNRGGPGYPLFVLISLLPYKWLVSSVTGSMGTIRSNGNLIANLYFPRALLPFVELSVGMSHFLVGLLIVPLFMLIFGVAPTWNLLWLPVVIAVQYFFMLGLAYPAAAIGLNYRNLPKLTGNLLRLWFYLSPGIWALTEPRIADKPTLLTLIKINPLTGLFESYRGAIGVLSQDCPVCPSYQVSHAPGWELLSTIGFGALLLLVGGWYYRRREQTFGKVLL